MEGSQKLLFLTQAKENLRNLNILDGILTITCAGGFLASTIFHYHPLNPDWLKKNAWWVTVGIAVGCKVTRLEENQRELREIIDYEKVAARMGKMSVIHTAHGLNAYGDPITGSVEIGNIPTGFTEPEQIGAAIIRALGEGFDTLVDWAGYQETPRLWRLKLKAHPGVKIKVLQSLAEDLQAQTGLKNAPIFAAQAGYISCDVGKSKPPMMLFSEYISDVPPSTRGLHIPIGINEEFKLETVNLVSPLYFSGLVGGTSGSGKSIWTNTVLSAIHKWYTPEQIQLILLDLKQVEFFSYEYSQFLWKPVATEIDTALKVLSLLVQEKQRREKLLKAAKCRNLEEYNKSNPTNQLPYLFCIADEISIVIGTDVDKEIKDYAKSTLGLLAKTGRSSGICLYCTVQKPLASEIPTIIQANLKFRLGFKTTDKSTSFMIMRNDAQCQFLLGEGDAYACIADSNVRIQSLYIDETEIQNTIAKWQIKDSEEQDEVNINYPHSTIEVKAEIVEPVSNIEDVSNVSPISKEPNQEIISSHYSEEWTNMLEALQWLDSNDVNVLSEEVRVRFGGILKPSQYPDPRVFTIKKQKLPNVCMDLISSLINKQCNKWEIIRLIFNISKGGGKNPKAQTASELFNQIKNQIN